jgi:hypothetical protein
MLADPFMKKGGKLIGRIPRDNYQFEGLEQLRFLENGLSIKCVPVKKKNGTYGR